MTCWGQRVLVTTSWYRLGNEVILYGHFQSPSVQGKVFERLL